MPSFEAKLGRGAQNPIPWESDDVKGSGVTETIGKGKFSSENGANYRQLLTEKNQRYKIAKALYKAAKAAAAAAQAAG